MNDLVKDFDENIHRLLLLKNGLTNYSRGIHNQIKNCEIIISDLSNDYGKKTQTIEKINEIKKFLEAIVELGGIENMYK